jgi:hypothetical protein
VKGLVDRAAEHFDTCRARGLPILTTDADFVRFATILPIEIHGR